MSLEVVAEKEIDLGNIIKSAKQLNKEVLNTRTNFEKLSESIHKMNKGFDSANSTLRQMKMHRFDNLISAATKLATAVGAFKAVQSTLRMGERYFYGETTASIAKTNLNNQDAFQYMLRAKGLDRTMGISNVSNFAEQLRTPDTSAHRLVAAILGLETSENLRKGNFDAVKLYIQTLESLKQKIPSLSSMDMATFFKKNGLDAQGALGLSYNQFEMLQGKGNLMDEFNRQLDAMTYTPELLASLGKEWADLKISWDILSRTLMQEITPLLSQVLRFITSELFPSIRATYDILRPFVSAVADKWLGMGSSIVEASKQANDHYDNWKTLGFSWQSSGIIAEYMRNKGLSGDEKSAFQSYLYANKDKIEKDLKTYARSIDYLNEKDPNAKIYDFGFRYFDRHYKPNSALNDSAYLDRVTKGLIKHEGFSSKPYLDSNNEYTIGYGTQLPTLRQYGLTGYLTQDAKGNYSMSKNNAYEAMRLTADAMIKEFKGLIGVDKAKAFDKLPEDARVFLADLIYNAGASKVAKSSVANQLLAGDYAKAAETYRKQKWQLGERKDDQQALLDNLAKQQIVVNVNLDGRNLSSTTHTIESALVSTSALLPSY